MPGARERGSSPRRFAALALIGILAAPGCLTYSSYQSAKILERGERRATVSVSGSSKAHDGSDYSSWIAFEGIARGGIARRVDGSIMLSVFRGMPDEWGAGVVTVDVRGGLVENYLACSLPVSITVGDLYLASLRVQPGLIGTIPIGEKFEINGAIRAHVFVRTTEVFAVGYNVGLGITTPSGLWTIRPELGWLRYTQSDELDFSGSAYAQYGVGIERHLQKLHAAKEQGQ